MNRLAGLWKSFVPFLYSIRFRLVMWFTAILALILLAFNGFVYFSQARDIRGDALFRQDQKLTYVIQALNKTQGVIPPNVLDRKSTRLNSSHIQKSRMPSSA